MTINTSSYTVQQFLHALPLKMFSNILHNVTMSCLLQPEKLVSPTLVLRQQKGNSFDHSILLCSLLLGVGYDAYCVCGYATREVCMMDQTRNICPALADKVEVHRKLLKHSI